MFKHWKDHFHPHEGNDHKPEAYRAVGAVALGLVVLSIVSLVSLQTSYITSSDRFLSAVLPSVLVDLANKDRAAAGLDGLEANEILQAAAQLKADHMAENSYFAHNSPDGTTPWEWFAQAGYEYETAGENLAINFSDSADVEAAWMDSPRHRDNILEENFTEIGIATAKGVYEGEETVFVVQLFGHPSATELAQRETDSSTQDDEPELAVANNVTPPAEDSSAEELAVDQGDIESNDEETVGSETDDIETSTDSDRPREDSSATDQATDTGSKQQVDSTLEADESSTSSSLTTTTIATTDEVTTTASTFATPTPIAQVQGEAGISLNPFGSRIDRQASQLSYFLSQPESLFRTLMMTLFALVALVLLVSVGVEAKRHHVHHALKSLGALVALLVIFYLGTNYLFPDAVVPSQSDSRLSAEMLSVGSTPSL